MASQHGITSLTHERIVMGPGQVMVGTTVLGATKGGNVLEINETIRDIRPDGSLGKMKGYRYLENGEYTLTTNLMEIDEDRLLYALAGASLSANVITLGDIAAATYLASVTLACEIKGVTATTEATLVTVTLTNCLVEGPVTLNLPESGETVLSMKFVAHWDPAALTTRPLSITFTPAT